VEINKILDKAMPGIAIELAGELKIKTPADTGRLRNSIKIKSNKNGLVITMANYGKFVEFGTLPHIIKPKNKKALSWKGAKHPMKMIKHPGNRPNPFIRTTLRQKLPNIISKHLRANL